MTQTNAPTELTFVPGHFRYVSQHIRLSSQKNSLILQYEPRDAWCLRGG